MKYSFSATVKHLKSQDTMNISTESDLIAINSDEYKVLEDIILNHKNIPFSIGNIVVNSDRIDDVSSYATDTIDNANNEHIHIEYFDAYENKLLVQDFTVNSSIGYDPIINIYKSNFTNKNTHLSFIVPITIESKNYVGIAMKFKFPENATTVKISKVVDTFPTLLATINREEGSELPYKYQLVTSTSLDGSYDTSDFDNEEDAMNAFNFAKERMTVLHGADYLSLVSLNKYKATPNDGWYLIYDFNQDIAVMTPAVQISKDVPENIVKREAQNLQAMYFNALKTNGSDTLFEHSFDYEANSATNTITIAIKDMTHLKFLRPY